MGFPTDSAQLGAYLMTTAPAINAIPYLCQAEPGLYGSLDLDRRRDLHVDPRQLIPSVPSSLADPVLVEVFDLIRVEDLHQNGGVRAAGGGAVIPGRAEVGEVGGVVRVRTGRRGR